MKVIQKLLVAMSKRPRVENEELVEKHDGAFAGPLAMFPTFPHNITFEESRELVLQANPSDEDAESYTFIHNRQEYGIMKTEDATISATLKLVAAANGADLANTRRTAPMLKPLVFGWKTKEVYVNNDMINATSTHESELQYINYLFTQTPTGTKDKDGLCLGYRDTGGHFDDTTGFHNGTAVVNRGGRNRARGVNASADYDCLDHLDLLKSRTETKKKQSKVIPCAKKFLNQSISQRSKYLTNTVRTNLLHICDFVYRGKFPIVISSDNKRFLKHLLDKRTPKEDVQVGLTEDLRTHAIIREVIDKIESSNGYGTS
jgi:hypothetical protein